MPIPDILSLLHAERDKLDRAINALEFAPKRRGRPPKMAGGGGIPTPFKARKRRGMSAGARKRQSARMKAYWAAKRKGRKG